MGFAIELCFSKLIEDLLESFANQFDRMKQWRSCRGGMTLWLTMWRQKLASVPST